MEQTGSSIEDHDLAEVPKVATKRLGVEERRIAWEGSEAEFTESNMIMAMSTGIGDHSNNLQQECTNDLGYYELLLSGGGAPRDR